VTWWATWRQMGDCKSRMIERAVCNFQTRGEKGATEGDKRRRSSRTISINQSNKTYNAPCLASESEDIPDKCLRWSIVSVYGSEQFGMKGMREERRERWDNLKKDDQFWEIHMRVNITNIFRTYVSVFVMFNLYVPGTYQSLFHLL